MAIAVLDRARPHVPRRTARPAAANLATGALVALAVAGSPIGLAWTFEAFDYDIWGAFVWGPILLAGFVPICRRVARRCGEPEMVTFFMGAAVLKIVIGSVTRYQTAEAFYGGIADAARYDNAAAVLVPQFRAGNFDGLGALSGTRFIEVLTGVVQAVIGQTRMGSFLVFSAMGFAGMLLLYLAFCEAVPGGDRTLYRRLLFLTPSIWYWPSSIGKEAFMLLCLGGAFYGAARVLRGHLAGLLPGVLGLWGTLVVRPHLTLAFAVGFVLALPLLAERVPAAVASARHRVAPMAPVVGASPRETRHGLSRVLPLVALLALPIVIGRVEAFFNLDSLNADSAETLLDNVSDKTDKGDSAVVANISFTPLGLLQGGARVILRPFPWEAVGPQGLVSSFEAAGVGVLVFGRIVRHLKAFVRWARARWVRLALGYSVAFAGAFSAVVNTGILVRQRSLLLPLLFVVVAFPRADTGRTTDTGATT